MTIFLFGKLPAFGDFVARGLDRSLRDRWDEWCSAAIVDAKARLGADFDIHYRATPPRRFLVSPTLHPGPWQAGCVFPAWDRVGRSFPFILGISCPGRPAADDARDLADRLAAAVGEPARWDSLDALADAARRAIDGREVPVRRLDPIPDMRADWIGRQPIGLDC